MAAKALVDYIDATVRLSIDARNTNMLRLLDTCIDDIRCGSVTATKTEADTFVYTMQLRDAVRVAVRAAAFDDQALAMLVALAVCECLAS